MLWGLGRWLSWYNPCLVSMKTCVGTPEPTFKNSDVVVGTYIVSTGEVETGGPLRLPDQSA